MAKKRTHAGQKRVAEFEQYARNQELWAANKTKELNQAINDLKAKMDNLNASRRIWKLGFMISSSFLVASIIFG